MTSKRKKKDYETELAKAQLEALKVRMNPHFIANVLTSIRSMMFLDQKDTAIDYLTLFANLMRKTLDNATKEFISLAAEIDYISSYLKMEELRFAGKFETEIQIPDSINTADIIVPPTIFQPFIENAINHGLMHQLKGGRLTIRFELDSILLKCIIEDNGVGRKRSREIETRSITGKSSLSEQITHDRMKLFNKIFHTNEFSIITEDLYDDSSNPNGTRVIIYLPQISIYDLPKL